MPLQIVRLKNPERRRSSLLTAIILGFVEFISVSAVFADSGAYKSSKHADPAFGVRRDANYPVGNCSQCHQQHDGDTPNNFALFAPDDNTLCQSSGCHEYEYQWPTGDYYWSYPGNVPNWYNSAHGASSGVFPPARDRQVRLCVQCHNPHGAADSIAGVYPSATASLEENGCYSYNGLAGQGCHGLNNNNRPFGAVDIYSMTLKSSRHNVAAIAKAHSGDWSRNFPYGREPRTTNSGAFSGANRHVECVDCHNPHKATNAVRNPGRGEIGGALLGAWGVEPTNGGAWTVPTIYRSIDFNSLFGSREYQLCFKCHSYYAYGSNVPVGQSDIAREFNPANRSYHPVEDTIRTNSYTVPSAANGFTETMESPWNIGQHVIMTCSDCHASENSGDPRGPHGSNQPYILIGSPSATDITFCTKCHKASVYAPPFDPGSQETGSRFDRQTTGDGDASHYFHVTEWRYGCRQCHGGRQQPPPASPEQRAPYPVEVGSAHGSNTFSGLINGTNINTYSPGGCTPTCHERKTYNAGPE